ncbi:MAG: dienelactone hydrolase family protein [Thiomonas sp.]|uniref:Putative hydrolase n=1 Tax=mine drainage metagenome TaxID=410659 RepID=E6PT64_9ZZZZ
MQRPATIDVQIPTHDVVLDGILALVGGARGIVVFAHGSGSSRFSRRNRDVAEALQAAGLATLLFDLLSAEENARDRMTAEHRFDIALLARRLTDTVDWLGQEAATRALHIGLFGASTGAAAALITAAERPQRVDAIVSRGGRPDLAGDALGKVQAPTLLIVGGWDPEVIALNALAARQLTCAHRTAIVPNATHLFEEPGKLEQVSRLAAAWFATHLSATNS